MIVPLLIALARSVERQEPFNIRSLFAFIEEANKYVKSLGDKLSDLMETSFFVNLRGVRQFFVNFRNDYLDEHKRAYDDHQVRVKEIRDKWRDETKQKKV
jgi:hypothetical protein